jgi:predicted RNA-binding protein
MAGTYWMLALPPDNFGITRDRGFTIQGFRAPVRRKVQRMHAGDRLLFYLSWVQKFAATATVTSSYFEEHTQIWKHHKMSEDYPYRINIKPAVVLEEDQFIDAHQIAPRMEYVKKWTPERWPLAFLGDLHIIPHNDFSLIEIEMEKLNQASNKL